MVKLMFGAPVGQPPVCRFGLLGPTSVLSDDGRPVVLGGGKRLALLALLLVDANRVVPVARLEDMLWAGEPPGSARSALHAYASRLRAALRDVSGAELIGRRGSYELAIDPDELDVHRFETRLAGGDSRDIAVLDGALALWRGPALVDVRFVDELEREAARLEELRLAVVEDRMDAELAAGRHATAVGLARRLIAEHPYRERLHGQLMLALYRSGRQSEALSAYQQAYRLLRDEVGVPPGAALRALERAIATQDPRLDLAPEAASSPVPVVAGGRSVVTAAGPGPLAAAWADACAGRRRLVAVHLPGGIPGPAVEPLVRRLLGTTAGAGAGGPARLLRCRVRPDAADPYEPVVGALAAAGHPTSRPAGPFEDPPAALYLFLEALVGQLQALAAERPLVLLFEDLHLGGRSLLALVEHLVRHRDRAPILPVAALAGRSGALGGLLTRLRFDGLCTSVDAEGAGADQELSGPAPAGAPPGPGPVAYRAMAQAHLLDAVRLATRAGDAAAAHLGFDEAAGHYRAALDALAVADPGAAGRRAGLLIARARALHAVYALTDAIDAYRDAAHAAVAAGDDELLAEAAVGLATGIEYGMVDEALFAVLRDALARAAAGAGGAGDRDLDPAVRARVLAGMARTLPVGDPVGVALAAEADELARRCGDRMVMARALATRVSLTWSAGNAGERRALLDDLVALADDIQALDLAMEGRYWRAATCEQLGDKPAAERDRAIVVAWADQTRRPYFVALAALHTVAGHLDAGRVAKAESALAAVPAAASLSHNFAAALAAQHLAVRLLRGHRDELVPLLDAAAADPGVARAWHATRPLLLAESGRPDEARRELPGQVQAVAAAPRDWLWLCSTAQVADAAIAIGDRVAAGRLLPLLEPLSGQQVVLAHGALLLGSVDARLAGLAALAGDGPRSEGWYRRAVNQEAGWGSALALLRTVSWRSRAGA